MGNNKQIKLGNESTVYFSEEIVEEILSRLPVHSLFRFKAVSKSWNTLISSPSFAESHLNNYGNSNNFVLLAFDQTTRKWKLSFTTFGTSSSSELTTVVVGGGGGGRADEKFIELPTMLEKTTRIKDKIIGPFNGLICFYGIAGMAGMGGIALCDPNLRTTETLPICPITEKELRFSTYVTRSMGFGLDSVTKEIKLVQTLSYLFWYKDTHIEKGIRVDIYSPTNKTWRHVLDHDDAATSDTFIWDAIGSYEDGSFSHWIDNNQSVVLSFDMQKEVFVRTPIPIEYDHFKHEVKIFAKGSTSLVLFAYPRQRVTGENYLFDRWELNGLKHWSRLTRVGPFLGVTKPVGALWRSRVIVVRGETKLVFYDYSTQHVMRIYDMEGNDYHLNCRDLVKVLEYKGSLL
ncbi:hypothetical protein ABFS82_05G100500 [Erythranthe guttata]|uniref:F-box domain-containing protein n=1 Tax=Erythranthe guttata TaxID=4155 RepID=A0A022RDR5_ERYGU|nr:PREDICTED: F-box/LRR-repeat/kelch-repeat protein At1g09650-like [Erythranthe guttata]EYU38376.1 hypothetical protein MIMGU_mgv1a026679mg [Erythranthe guttata]|eukprot:XP_012836249.1 PREDICTED: F-box/LRR-repeat/kelch-repeat protein At1g09650-like [Erythranthe guttata]